MGSSSIRVAIWWPSLHRQADVYSDDAFPVQGLDDFLIGWSKAREICTVVFPLKLVHVFQELAKELVDLFKPTKMAKVFFTNSGSEANDTQVYYLSFSPFCWASVPLEIQWPMYHVVSILRYRLFCCNSWTLCNAAASGYVLSFKYHTQVKLVWYYNNARGKPEKKKFIARNKA